MVLKPPSEKGASKTVKTPKSRSRAWLTSEREDARFLNNVDGKNDVYGPLTTSTGRLGHLNHLQFDSISKHYAIETKQRVLAAWIRDAWVQINQLAMKHRLYPVLILHISPTEDKKFIFEGKSYKVPEMHCITSDRHRQLLEYEARCELMDLTDQE